MAAEPQTRTLMNALFAAMGLRLKGLAWDGEKPRRLPLSFPWPVYRYLRADRAKKGCPDPRVTGRLDTSVTNLSHAARRERDKGSPPALWSPLPRFLRGLNAPK